MGCHPWNGRMQIPTNNGSRAPETVVSQERLAASSRSAMTMLLWVFWSAGSHHLDLTFPLSVSCGELILPNVRYISGCSTSTSELAIARALRIFGAGVCSHTRRCSRKVWLALGAAAILARSYHHFPCSHTPPSVSFEPTKFMSNILAGHICKRKIGSSTPRQDL